MCTEQIVSNVLQKMSDLDLEDVSCHLSDNEEGPRSHISVDSPNHNEVAHLEETSDGSVAFESPSSGKKRRKATRVNASRKPSKKKRSVAWNLFKVVTVPSKKKKGATKVKAKMHSMLPSIFLLRRRNQDLFEQSCSGKEASGPQLPPDGSRDLSLPTIVNLGKYDHQKICETIAKMIIVHKCPFRMVENTWFNVLLKSLNPSYQCIGRRANKTSARRFTL